MVWLLRIKPLTDLGLPLPQVAQLGNADEHPEQALRVLDGELAATIEQLERTRTVVGRLLCHGTGIDLPRLLAQPLAEVGVTEADRLVSECGGVRYRSLLLVPFRDLFEVLTGPGTDTPPVITRRRLHGVPAMAEHATSPVKPL
ncbi:hypothetical protein GCM10010174_47850 [Kutzneria viridogrisea]|uniref:Uncharacterized protein n=1 Tax=Kutzneria viridogrisea TaxID=47990 RepID=A0ABR6B9K4_9PSEU|nr:hypothetical protein [Kutzneria viridogrisea]